MIILYRNVVFVFFVLFAGLYLIVYGWRILVLRQENLGLLEKFSIALIRAFQGTEAAQKMETELKSPKKIRLLGICALIGGVYGIVAGVFLVMNLFLTLK